MASASKSLKRRAKAFRKISKTKPSSLRVRAAYEAGSTGRRLRLWRPGMLGPNSSLLGDLDVVRARSRDSARNNGWIKRGINSWVSNEIGLAITPKSMAPEASVRELLDGKWKKWVKLAHADKSRSQVQLSAARAEISPIFTIFVTIQLT